MAELDMDAFEARFAERLVSFAAITVAPVDADAVARSVVVTRRQWWLGRSQVMRLPTLAWVIVAIATAIVGGLVAGALLQHLRAPAGPPLVIALEDGLYVGEVVAGERRRIRDDGMFIAPRWSPDGSLIAVLHGPPVPPQAGVGGRPSAPNRFKLRPDELLVLDTGREHGLRVPGSDRRARLGAPGCRRPVAARDRDGGWSHRRSAR